MASLKSTHFHKHKHERFITLLFGKQLYCHHCVKYIRINCLLNSVFAIFITLVYQAKSASLVFYLTVYIYKIQHFIQISFNLINDFCSALFSAQPIINMSSSRPIFSHTVIGTLGSLISAFGHL